MKKFQPTLTNYLPKFSGKTYKNNTSTDISDFVNVCQYVIERLHLFLFSPCISDKLATWPSAKEYGLCNDGLQVPS